MGSGSVAMTNLAFRSGFGVVSAVAFTGLQESGLGALSILKNSSRTWARSSQARFFSAASVSETFASACFVLTRNSPVPLPTPDLPPGWSETPIAPATTRAPTIPHVALFFIQQPAPTQSNEDRVDRYESAFTLSDGVSFETEQPDG